VERSESWQVRHRALWVQSPKPAKVAYLPSSARLAGLHVATADDEHRDNALQIRREPKWEVAGVVLDKEAEIRLSTCFV